MCDAFYLLEGQHSEYTVIIIGSHYNAWLHMYSIFMHGYLEQFILCNYNERTNAYMCSGGTKLNICRRIGNVLKLDRNVRT